MSYFWTRSKVPRRETSVSGDRQGKSCDWIGITQFFSGTIIRPSLVSLLPQVGKEVTSTLPQGGETRRDGGTSARDVGEPKYCAGRQLPVGEWFSSNTTVRWNGEALWRPARQPTWLASPKPSKAPMGGLKLLCRLRARLKRRSHSPLDVVETEHGFAIDRVRWVGHNTGGTAFCTLGRIVRSLLRPKLRFLLCCQNHKDVLRLAAVLAGSSSSPSKMAVLRQFGFRKMLTLRRNWDISS